MPFTSDEEKRLKELLAGALDAGATREQLERQNILLAGLRTERTVGNVLGGMIRTEIGPGSMMIGPYRQDVDATFGLEFNLWIPTYLLRIKSATIRLQPKAIRSSVSVTAGGTTTPSGGAATSGTQTTPSGGGSTSGDTSTPSGGSASPSSNATGTTVQVADIGHTHIWADYQSATPGSYSSRLYDDGLTNSFNLSAAASGNKHTLGPNSTETMPTSAHTHVVTVPAHTHTIHNHTTPAHTHPVHDHTVPNHTHPSHGHTLTLAIAEGGLSTNLRLWIDNVDRTSALGGPWTAAAELDIRQYLINARQEPVTGVHSIKVTSTAVGAVEAVGDIYGVLAAVQ